MKYLILGIIFLFILLGFSGKSMNKAKKNNSNETMMIRIAEIEIDSVYFDQYISILKKESEASIKLESGVICIYPMFQKDNPTKIRLLEIYKDKAAYESHLQTPHFKYYKTTTLNMVKSLKLIEMESIDAEMMPMIFKKLDQNQ
jgi:quinol monooxygenase YgiN